MPCKICTFDTILWHNSALNTLYHFCPHCECISLDTSLYLSPHLEKKIYDHHHNSLENEGYVRMFEAFLDFFLGRDVMSENRFGFWVRPHTRFKRFIATKRP